MGVMVITWMKRIESLVEDSVKFCDTNKFDSKLIVSASQKANEMLELAPKGDGHEKQLWYLEAADAQLSIAMNAFCAILVKGDDLGTIKFSTYSLMNRWVDASMNLTREIIEAAESHRKRKAGITPQAAASSAPIQTQTTWSGGGSRGYNVPTVPAHQTRTQVAGVAGSGRFQPNQKVRINNAPKCTIGKSFAGQYAHIRNSGSKANTYDITLPSALTLMNIEEGDLSLVV